MSRQVFITVRRSNECLTRTIELKVANEDTLSQLRQLGAKKLGITAKQLQLFWQGRELMNRTDAATLNELGILNGCTLQGWDLTLEPYYWPPVVATPEGLVVDTKLRTVPSIKKKPQSSLQELLTVRQQLMKYTA